MMVTIEVGKRKKGMNFFSKEEQVLCRSFLHISQDPICRNGQRATTFWERITRHFNDTKPCEAAMHSVRSLKTK